MAAPELRLEVSLNLLGFRSEIQKLTNIAQNEFTPKINVKFNRQTLDAELNNLQRAIKRRVYHVEIGGNIDSLPDKIKALKEQLSSLESFKIDLGVGAVKSLSKRDASKIKSDLRAAILGEQKKIYVPASIKPSIVKKDVLDFKNAVQSKLSGITVKVKADLEAASISGGAKSRADIDADVRRKLQEISEIGAQRMAGGGGGVTEAARRAQLKRSLEAGGFDIGGLKDIGKQLGIANAGRYKNANSLINKIVADASIEMVKKYLDPQAVMRNSDRSGLSKVLDTFARGVFNMLGIDPASIRAQQQASKPKPFTPAGLLPSFTLKGAREEMMRQLTGGISPSASSGGGRGGKLAMTDASLQERLNNMEVRSVKVREVFDPREFESATLRIFRVIGDALESISDQAQSASSQAKNSRIEQSVAALMQSIDNKIKIAQARVRIGSGLFTGRAQVSDLGRTVQPVLPPSRVAGLLPPVVGRAPNVYSTEEESQSELFARREREARMRSALRGLSASSERGLRLPGNVFSGDAFTAEGGLDRVTGTGQPPQRGGAIVRHPGGPQLGAATRLPSDYFERGSTTDKYRDGLKLAAAATESFRAGQIPFISGLKSIAGEFGEATKQVLLYGTAYKGLAFITSLPGQILNAAKSQQQFTNGLQSATQGTGTFAKELLYVDNVQRAFGLNLQTTRTGFTKLFASMAPTGFDSGSIEKLFTGISAATASLQLTPDKAERVIYAFGQMASKGQIMSEELKGQLGDVLPGALSLFADAAGMSVKEFSEAMEKGEFVGNRFREVFAKVSDELMNRFGSGAQAAAKSLQGLINVVGGDFQRTLESFAPLANAAAESILKPLGGAFRQLSVAAKLATGEKGRLGGQVVQQEQLVQDLGAEAALGGPDAEKAKEQYEGAKKSLEALKITLENFNELAKDPAVIQQAESIKAFTNEVGRAASFVKNFALSIGGVLSPVLTFLGTNLSSVIGTVISLTLAFQGARLGLFAFAGVMTVVKGAVAAVGLLALVRQVGSFSAALAANATIGKTVASMFTVLGVSAKFAGDRIVFASGATIGFGTAVRALLATTGLGLLIAVIGSVGAAFMAMGQDAKQAAEDAKQAAKDMDEAARTGNVPQVEAGLRQAGADVQLIEDAQKIVRERSAGEQGIYGASTTPTLKSGNLSEIEKNTLAAAGIALPEKGATQRELLKQLNDLLAARKSVLQKGKSQLELAEKQRQRTGQGIPELGIKGTEPPEEDKQAAQRGASLLNAIEQREEAIAAARKQREESIANIRKNAAEEFMRMEQALADRRLKIEREIVDVKRKSADTLEDIQRQIRIAQGEDRDLVEAEQQIADIYRQERDANLAITQRIADEEKEQARNIADFQKKVAKDIQGANEAHTKRMGEIQQGYAKQVAKIIDEGTGKAGKRLAEAARLAAEYIQRSTLNNQIAAAIGTVVPARRKGVYNFADVGLQGVETKEEIMSSPVFKDTQAPLRGILDIDDRIEKLEKDFNLSRKPDIGQQFTALLGAEGGFEDIAQGGRGSYAVRRGGAVSPSSINMQTINDNVIRTVQQTLLNSRAARMDGVEDVDIPDQRRLTFGKGALTRPTGAMLGLAIGGELSDILVEYVKKEVERLRIEKLLDGASLPDTGFDMSSLSKISSESGYEDIAGLKPLPLQKMLQQIGRPYTELYKQIQRDITGLYAIGRREAMKVLKPDPVRTQKVLQRAQKVEEVRQTWNPLEAQSKELLNRTNPAPRSQSSQASLPTFDKVVRDMSNGVFERLNKMNVPIYGILGDISDYLSEGEREVLKKGVTEQLRQGVQPSRMPVGGDINTGRAHLTTAVRELTQELVGNSRNIPRAPAPSALPQSTRQLLLPLGDDSEWRKRFMEQTEPIQITPGVQNLFEGASLPGGAFDVSKVATDFGTIAAASILRGVLDVSRVPDASRSAQIAQSQRAPLPYKVGERVGYDRPVSQQVDIPGATEATRATEARSRLQETTEDATRKQREGATNLLFAKIFEPANERSKELTKQIDLVKAQAAAIRSGVNSALADEFVQIEANAAAQRKLANNLLEGLVERGLSQKDANHLAEVYAKWTKEAAKVLKKQTEELALQAKILAGEQAIEKLKEEIKLLLIIGDEERRLAELREQYGTEQAAQEVLNLEKIKENIQATRALIDGFVSSTTSDYKGFLKAVISGEDAADALKQLQASLKDKVLTIFLDFAMAPIEKSLKEGLFSFFKPKVDPKLLEQQKSVTALADNTAATKANTDAIKGLQGGAAGAVQSVPTIPFGESADAAAQSMSTIGDAFSSGLSAVNTSAQGWNQTLNFGLPSVINTSAQQIGQQGGVLGNSLGSVTGVIGAAASSIMGIVAGVSQMGSGGTSGVLGGIGSIFMGLGGALGGIGGMFGGGLSSAFSGGASSAIGTGASGWSSAFATPLRFANGGMVTGPTLGLVGEGKYNEAIVPLPDGRSIPVQMKGPSGGGLREAMSGNNGRAGGSPILNMSFQSTNINGVEYVSRDQLEAAMATTRKQAAKDGANRGMSMTLDKLQQSPQTRNRLGMR